jgi:hypothetical protein
VGVEHAAGLVTAFGFKCPVPAHFAGRTAAA